MRVFLGADHRGFELKEKIKKFLKNEGYEVVDKGAFKYNKDDDFVDYAEEVGEDVAYDYDSKGILFCGSGAGVEIAANKINGVRAFMGFDKNQVVNAARDDNPNILAISSDTIDFEKAKILIKAFLETKFVPSEKHLRRIDKIEELED